MVVGLYNYNGPAIAAALEGLGKKGKVLAAVFDEDDGTLDGIAARIDPGDGGPEAVPVRLPVASKWMHELATEGEAPRPRCPPTTIIDTGVDVINKDNVAPFSAQLAEMKKGRERRGLAQTYRVSWTSIANGS